MMGQIYCKDAPRHVSTSKIPQITCKAIFRSCLYYLSHSFKYLKCFTNSITQNYALICAKHTIIFIAGRFCSSSNYGALAFGSGVCFHCLSLPHLHLTFCHSLVVGIALAATGLFFIVSFLGVAF